MGYYTRHELTVIEGNDYKTDYEQEIADSTNDYGKEALWGGEVKWYDCDSDMIHYSEKHPNTLFMIEGVGEESADIWKAYYKNGKIFKTKAELKFEDYSEDKLI